MKILTKITIFILIIVIGIVGCYIFIETTFDDKISGYVIEKQVRPLVINVPEQRTDGVITIYDETGGVHLEYSGEIRLINDGSNGEKIEIEVTIPDLID